MTSRVTQKASKCLIKCPFMRHMTKIDLNSLSVWANGYSEHCPFLKDLMATDSLDANQKEPALANAVKDKKVCANEDCCMFGQFETEIDDMEEEDYEDIALEEDNEDQVIADA